MSLEKKFNTFMEEINFRTLPITNSQIANLMDLTLLDPAATESTLKSFSEEAETYNVAAICVLPQHLQWSTAPARIKIATVVNFPEGRQTTASVLQAIEHIITSQAIDEIDYVFPYQLYLADKPHDALSQCQQVYQLCQQRNLLLKVILESGAFPSLEVLYQLSREVIKQGCNFLKTSTGKITQGATPAAAFAMLQAIKDSQVDCGLKISGGIKKPEQARLYMTMAKSLLNKELDKSWFRIGASSLLRELQE
jgi:deoxyribose-phosphate aldolase